MILYNFPILLTFSGFRSRMGASTEEEAAAEARGRATRQSSGGAGR